MFRNMHPFQSNWFSISAVPISHLGFDFSWLKIQPTKIQKAICLGANKQHVPNASLNTGGHEEADMPKVTYLPVEIQLLLWCKDPVSLLPSS